MTTRRAKLAAAAVGLAMAVTGACAAPVDPLDPSLGAAFITRDENHKYGLTIGDGVVTARAADTNSETANDRLVFWRQADPERTDGETCATWVGDGSLGRQGGAALRIQSDNTRTRAITVTQNVFGFYHSVNVHVMDSGAAEPIQRVAQFTLVGLLEDGQPGFVAPLPWRLCVRLVGTSLDFVIWPTKLPQPEWGNPDFGGHVDLDPSLVWPGRFGWYIGHLATGESYGFAEMTVGDVPPPTTTATTTEPLPG